MVKSFKLIVETNLFEGLARCVRERKGINKNIKHDTKIYPQIDKNRCKIDARKSDATNIEHHQNWKRKGS